MKQSSSSPYAVKAAYTPQQIKRMQGNAFIEALPPCPGDDVLGAGLAVRPDFCVEQREWEDHLRIQQIKGLSNFLVPLENHLELARTIDSMMRESYVSRPPHDGTLQRKLQEVYSLQKQGMRFSQVAQAVGAQDSVALIGMPGMGKSTTVRRALAAYPPVIDHGEGVLQIPSIHVDMSSNGTSVKSLAIAIISAIDRLLPDCTYAKLHLSNTKSTSADALFYIAARLIALHHVGIIVADEIQHLSPVKGVQTVMTELVTMCNMLRVPLLFIGTYKASNILGADFRAARRAVGGLSIWGPLPRYDSGVLVPRGEDEPSQWADFVDILWDMQWVRKPGELTQELTDYLHDRSQGVIDLVIKLFAVAQVRAITSGCETVTQELLESVYQSNFGMVHEALEAMRSRKPQALERFADVACPDLDTAVRKCEAGAALQQQGRQLALRPSERGFATMVTGLLVDGGIDAETATRLAAEAETSGRSEAPLQAVARIVKELQPKPARKSSAKATSSGEVIYPDFTGRTADYRRAVAAAAQRNTPICEQLRELGMLQDAEELIPLV